MRVGMISVMTFAVVVGACDLAHAADKAKDLIVGKWDQKSDGKSDASFTFEFAKDGKFKIIVTKGDKFRTVQGRYTFNDDATVELAFEMGGEKITQILKIKVAKDELSTTDETGTSKTFKRAK